MRISAWSSDLCSSDLAAVDPEPRRYQCRAEQGRADRAGRQHPRDRAVGSLGDQIMRALAAAALDSAAPAGKMERRAAMVVNERVDPRAFGGVIEIGGASEEHTSELQSLMPNPY